MWDDFGAFVKTPTGRNYLAVRRHVLAMDERLLDRRLLDGLAGMVRQGRAEDALNRVDQMNDAWVLSPAYHGYAALALRDSGQLADAETEAFLRLRCLQGLAASGIGTTARPFKCTCPGDARELLVHLGESFRCQRLAPLGKRFCDVLEADSGRAYWMEAPLERIVASGRNATTAQAR